jgi:hypothetical protein
MERSGRNQCAPPPADDLATEAERGDVAHARTLELERARRRLHAHSLVAVSVRERLAATLVALTAEELLSSSSSACYRISRALGGRSPRSDRARRGQSASSWGVFE